MAKILLAKHAAPAITPAVPSARWVLSEPGRASCASLAAAWADLRPGALYASLEPKALETAALIARALGLEVRPREGLHENDRTGLPFVSIAELEELIQRFFAEPDAVVIGRETASAALARFEGALRSAIQETGEGTLAVVAHGTVLTLLVARHNAVDPFELWRRLPLASYVILDERFGWDGEVRAAGA